MSNAVVFEDSVTQSINEGVGPVAALKMQLEATSAEISAKFVEFDRNFVSNDRIIEMNQEEGFTAIENLYQGFKQFWIKDMITMLQLFMLNVNVEFQDVDDSGQIDDITEACRSAVNNASPELLEKMANEVATRYAKQMASVSMWMKTGYAYPEQSTGFSQVDPSPILAVRLLDKILIQAGVIDETRIDCFYIANASLDADGEDVIFEADDDDGDVKGPFLMGVTFGGIN
jgi:hypothetical protein